MVEKGAYCPDILIQVSAVNAALNSFNKVLLANHIKSCVTTDIRAGKEEKENCDIFAKFIEISYVIKIFIHYNIRCK